MEHVGGRIPRVMATVVFIHRKPLSPGRWEHVERWEVFVGDLIENYGTRIVLRDEMGFVHTLSSVGQWSGEGNEEFYERMERVKYLDPE